MGYVTFTSSTADYASAPHISAYNFDTDVDQTMELWFSVVDESPSVRSQLMSIHNASFSTGWGVYMNTSGSITYRYREGANSRLATFSAVGIVAGTKHHLAATHNFGANECKLYIDGTQKGGTVTPGIITGQVISTETFKIFLGKGSTEPATGRVYACAFGSGVASQSNIQAATSGTPAAGYTVVFDADFERLTVAEVAAGSFVEDSSNAATVTLNSTEWSYTADIGGIILLRSSQ